MKATARRFLGRHRNALLLTLVLLLFGGILSLVSDYFLTPKNISNLLAANAYRLILATAMSVVVASGAIDLSIGSIVALSGVLMAMASKAGWPVALALLLGLSAGAAMGSVNGLIIARMKLNPLIVTLATMSLYRGLALILTQGSPITKLPEAFLWWGRSEYGRLDPPLLLGGLLFLLAIPLLHRSKWGAYVMALGGNEEALRRQGVRTGYYRLSTHLLLGVYAAIVGLIVTARLNSAEANAGLNMEIDAITAAILGGTPLSGGRISLYGTLVAILLLGVMRNGLTLLSISSFYQQFLVGALLLTAIILAKQRQGE